MSFLQIWSSVGPFAGACVGYAATFVTDARADARAERRARSERSDARREKLQDEFRASELELLHDAHASLASYAERATLVNSQVQPTGWEAGIAAAAMRASAAVALIPADAIRETCVTARRAIAKGLTPGCWSWAEYDAAEAALAARIRTLRTASDQVVTTAARSNS